MTDFTTFEDLEPRPFAPGASSPNGNGPQGDDDGGAGTDGARFNYLDWATFWDEDRPVSYLVPGLIPEAKITSIWAPSGAGKSLLCQEWALCLALGRKILGEPTTQRTVLYIDVENSKQDIADRLESFRVEPGTDLSRLHYSHLGDWAPFDTEQGGEQLVAEVDRLGVALVVLDTTGRLIDGDENEADTFNNMSRQCLLELRRRGVSMWMIDNAGKDLKKKQRGTSAKEDVIDLAYRLTKVSGTEVALTRTKNRCGLPGGDGAITNLVRVGGDGHRPLSHELADRDSSEDARAIEVIEALNRLGVPANTSRRSAAKALRDDGMKVGTATLTNALNRRKHMAPGTP